MLGSAYQTNLKIVTNQIAPLKEYNYDELLAALQEIELYLSSVQIGDGNVSATTKFKDILTKYNQLLAKINSAKIIVNRVLPVRDSMVSSAKEIPGADPVSQDDMVNNPKKYTIPVRLFSDAAGNLSTTKIIFSIDQLINRLNTSGAKITQLQSVKLNEFSKIESSINSKKTVTDKGFQNALAEQQARLNQLKPITESYKGYAKNIPEQIRSSYQKAQDKKIAPLNNLINESNNIWSTKYFKAYYRQN